MRGNLLILIPLQFGVIPTAQKTLSPAQEALKLFNTYKATIERTNDAIIDEPIPIPGDLNGDGREDCIIFFVMTSRSGGNAIVGRDAAIYINKGNKVKVIGSFNLKICYTIEKIVSAIIYVNQYECSPPYNTFIRIRNINCQEINCLRSNSFHIFKNY
jgi:hypothetical protein